MNTKRSIPVVGERFGRWVVIGSGFRNWATEWKKSMVVCRCDCGVVDARQVERLRSGSSASCGCSRRRPDGTQANPAEYSSWKHMIYRCYDESVPEYVRYGGRGIEVCDRWRDSFQDFLLDMGRRPGSGYTLDRIDNSGNYEPSNCRWATRIQQVRNMRSNRIITAFGRSQPMSEWAEEFGVASHVIKTRLNSGWSAEDAILRPLQKRPVPANGGDSE